jgi:predicted ATPase
MRRRTAHFDAQEPAMPRDAGRGGAGGRKTTRAGARAARDAVAPTTPAPPLVSPRLRAVTHAHPRWADERRFPFSVPSIRAMATLDLDVPVTCFVGENGSGKSTLLEALAVATGLPVAGGAQRAADDPTLAEQALLARALVLDWSLRTTRGFFLRAEDFFGWQQAQQRLRVELAERLAAIDVELADASEHARALARGPLQASLTDMEARYGADPDARSHGEAFLAFFQRRLVPRGLYLLDEPEAALSPQRQLALVALVLEAVDAGAQFVIATHSPILLAIPGARVWSFDDGAPTIVPWDETDHVRLTRDFLASPERILSRLR